jgi:DNA-directed RNA polymerase specialized sigma24 family protein
MRHTATYPDSVHGQTTAPAYRAELKDGLERDSAELRWIVKVILGSAQHVEACLLDAIRLAERGGYVAPEWLEHWTQRAAARIAVDKVRADIQTIAENYMRRSDAATMVHALSETERRVLRSIEAEKIGRSCDALERATLILHGYLGFSVQDCALLLECHRSVVEPACASGLQKIIDKGLVTEIAEHYVDGFGASEVPA